MSRPLGLRRPREVKTHLASPLSSGANGFAPGDMVELPTIGPVWVSHSLYVMHEESSTIGLLVGRDQLEQNCVLTLSLERTEGPNNWRAIVERVTRAGGHSDDGIGTSFCFSSRCGDAERVLKAVRVR